MTELDVVYGLHWICVAAMLAIGWARGRSLLHPLFILACIFSVMISDFLIRGYDLSGYDDADLLVMPVDSMLSYQVTILAVFVLTIIIASAFGSESLEDALRATRKPLLVSRQVLSAIACIGVAVAGAEIVKRLSSVGWSPAEVWAQMLHARGDRVWDQEHYNGNFIFAIINIVQPLAAFAFAYLVVNACGRLRLVGIAGYLAVLTILVTDASRTQVVIALVALVMFVFTKDVARTWKLVICAGIATAGAAMLSLIYIYRSVGFTGEAADGREFALTYHQDDSYYRAVWAFYVADHSGYSWDPWQYIYAIVGNPFPRALWPDKPILDEYFWGDYKLYYVTNTYLGEIVAMAGTALTPVFGVLYGLFVYAILYAAVGLMRYPLGVAAYLLVALYAYMSVRSSMSLVHFIYLPAFGVLCVIVLNRLQQLTAAPTCLTAEGAG